MNDAAIDTTDLEAAILKDAHTESDFTLEREATAESAVAVVMRQRGKRHPTLFSAWTTREIARLLHALADDPGAEVRLGDQYLGKGLAKRDPVARSASVSVGGTPIPWLAGIPERAPVHVEDYSKQGSEG